MKYLETEHEKRSFIITTIIFVIILILCFFLGMTYLDPPPENGIAINFGTTEFGSGEVQPTEPVASSPQAPQTPSQPTPAVDEVATQDVEDAPVIAKEKPKKETPKETKPKEVPKPKPSQATTDALNSLLNGPKSDGKPAEGQGKDGRPGDAGDPDGSLKGDYGGGSGDRGTGDKNYQLGNRGALTKPKPKYTCNEQGVVVVQIFVDKTGKVISANPGARGTTNSASCLLEQAKIAAMQTKWESDPNAMAKQEGKIVYNFRLTD